MLADIQWTVHPERVICQLHVMAVVVVVVVVEGEGEHMD